jgi:hypothetical protein
MTGGGTGPRAAADLDHVGLVGRDLMPLMRAFDQLGFRLTEPRLLMRQNATTGERESLEQSSCHAVFRQGYIEFSAVHTRSVRHHLAAYLDHGPALKIIALGTNDVLERHAAAERGGLGPTLPALASREVTYGSRPGEARFRWFMIDPDRAPEGLLCMVRNLTPEIVYQPEVQRHPNGAVALTAVSLCVEDVDRVAERYALLLGIEPIRPADSDRVREFDLGNQRVRIATPAALADRYEGVQIPPGPCLAGFTVAVESIPRAAALLGSHDIGFRRFGGNGLVIALEAAGGTIVELVAPA